MHNQEDRATIREKHNNGLGLITLPNITHRIVVGTRCIASEADLSAITFHRINCGEGSRAMNCAVGRDTSGPYEIGAYWSRMSSYGNFLACTRYATPLL